MAESRHDLKSRWIQLKGLISNTLDPIFAKSKMRYGQDFVLDNPRDLVDLQTASRMIGGNGSLRSEFTEADLESDGSDGYFLPFALPQLGFPIGVRVIRLDNDATVFLGFGNYVYDTGFTGMPFPPEDGDGNQIPQIIIVFYIGNPPTINVLGADSTSILTDGQDNLIQA